MARSPEAEQEALRRFLRRIWREDVRPLLNDRRAAERAKAARVGGTLAAGAGLALDGLLGLKGKPFTRFMTVVGARVAALLPDAWDFEWLRSADATERDAVADAVQRRAVKLELDEALALFDLSPGASADHLKGAWRRASQRWHPDKAPDDGARAEYHVRFVAYQSAYERLSAAYAAGELPHPKGGS